MCGYQYSKSSGYQLDIRRKTDGFTYKKDFTYSISAKTLADLEQEFRNSRKFYEDGETYAALDSRDNEPLDEKGLSEEVQKRVLLDSDYHIHRGAHIISAPYFNGSARFTATDTGEFRVRLSGKVREQMQDFMRWMLGPPVDQKPKGLVMYWNIVRRGHIEQMLSELSDLPREK